MTPYEIHVPDEVLADLRDRLRRTRWPDRETVTDWSQGVPLAVVQELCAYWADDYDWRRAESALNAWPQVVTEIDGIAVHALHARSPHPDATPLLLTHGWPGSVVEFLGVLGPLTRPERHGGRAEDALHVVCPSLPGYGFSGRPAEPGWGIQRIADVWAVLMKRLGYDRYVAGGGDWGTSISTMQALRHPGRILGLHLTPPLVAPDPATYADLTPPEEAAIAALEDRSGSAYGEVHATRPQTLGYGLSDSPSGLCAWILDKLWAWTDGDLWEVLGRDRVLDDITLYWVTGTAASSTRLYWESIATVTSWFTEGAGDRVDVPTAASVFHDLPRPSRRWVQRRFTDLRYWSEPAVGGHFAAWEQPAVFVAEVRAALAALR